MKRWTKLLSTVIGLAIIACAGFITWRVWPRTQHVYTDADTIHTPQEKALVRDILWTPPTRLPDSLNSAGDDYEPEHSTDGRTLLFVRGKAGRNADIYTCNKIADGWSEPAPLDTINTEHDELGPELSPGKMDLNIPTEVEIPWYEKLPPGAVGLIRGRVTEAESEHSLPDATIRLVLPDDETLAVLSDETGRYELAVPPVPKFFAVSASLESYIPESVNVPRSRLRRGPITLHFRLEPQREDVIALEAEPDVHHLGNNRFEGRINSQFQNRSEGKRYRASFTISDAQLKADYAQAEVRLMAKGVQCPHQIRINGRLLHGRLNDSPRDGSFGDFAARFDPTWLTSGVNRFKITAKSCRGDLDDFEFVNIRIIPTP